MNDPIRRTMRIVGFVYFVMAMGWRSALQWRRTGDTGFRLSRTSPLPDRAASTLMAVGGVATAAATVAPRARLVAVPRPVRWLGVALTAIAVPLTTKAQLDLGASWRVGVDQSERTELMTTGLFASMRNPIFTGMALASVGGFLAAPGRLSALGVAGMVGGMQLQVRAVEEPYLRRVHGAAFDRYVASTGRFLPRA